MKSIIEEDLLVQVSKLSLNQEEVEQSQRMLNLTLELISKGNEQLSKQAADEAILLIGRTGVGKSTLVNYLADPKNMHATWYKAPQVKYGKGKLVLDVKNQEGSLAKVGHKMDSETTIPNRWESKGVLYWDCPGFDHMDNPTTAIAQDIANAFFIKKIFDVTKSVKVLLVLSWDELNATRVDKIKAITDQLGNLFQGKGFSKILDSLSLIVTKTDGQEEDDVKGKLEEAINAECFKYKSTGRDIIEFLLESENRISTFNIPKNEGSIFEGQNEARLGFHKHGEMLKIINTSKFVDQPNVNIAVAKDSLIAVEEIAKNINSKIIETVWKICDDMEKSYQESSKYVVKNLKSVNDTAIDYTVNLIKFLSLLRESVTKLIAISSNSNTVETFVIQFQEHQKLIKQDIKFNEHVLSQLFNNIEYISFFKQVSKNAEKNVKVDQWISEFEHFNKSLIEYINITKGELQTKFSDENKGNLEKFIKQLSSYANRLAEECYKNKNYSEYKMYERSFKELAVLLKQESLEFDKIINYLEDSVLKIFNLKIEDLQKVKISYYLNKVIDFNGTAAMYEEGIKAELKAVTSEICNSYKESINGFARNTSSKVENSIKNLIKELYGYAKTVKSEKDLLSMQEMFEEVLSESKASKDLNQTVQRLINMCKGYKLKESLVTEAADSISVLNDIISVEDNLQKTEMIPLIGRCNESLDACINDFPSLRKNLVDNILDQAKKELGSCVFDFVNKVTIFASLNKDKVDPLINTLEKYLEQIKEEIDIAKSIEIIKETLTNNFPELGLLPLNQILNTIKSVNSLENIDKLVKNINWNQEIQKLTQELKDIDSALVKQELTKNIGYLEDLVTKEIESNVSNLKNTSDILKLVKNIFTAFPTTEELYFKAGNVGQLVTQLIDTMNKSKLDSLPIKEALLAIKDKTYISLNDDIGNGIKCKVLNISKYLKEETIWYDAISKSIYTNLSSPKFVFDSSNVSCYRQLDQNKFNDLLDKFSIEDVPYTATRLEQLQKLIDITLGSSSSVNYSGGKYVLNGNFVKMSDVLNSAGSSYFVEVVASDTVYFDVTSIYSSVGMTVIAPKWYIPNIVSINLNGNSGTSYYDRASDGYYSGASGSNGYCGGAGTSAGHFYGIIGNDIGNCINDLSYLRVTANGGNGGRGQDGGNGYKGSDGSDAGSVNTSNYSNKWVSTTLTSDSSKACKVVYELKGSNGGYGGNGGNAGCGGNGGYAGTIKLYKNSNNIGDKITVSAQSGSTGSNGNPGSGGSGGRNGDTTRDMYVETAHTCSEGGGYHNTGWLRDCTIWSGEKQHYSTNGYASNGSSGGVNWDRSSPYNNEPEFREKVKTVKTDFADLVISKEQNADDFGIKVQLPMLREFYKNIQLSGNGLTDIDHNNFDYDRFFNKYYGEGIDEILNLRLKTLDSNKLSIDKVKAIKADFIFNSDTTSAKQIVFEALSSITQDGYTKVLVPYNIENKHWVGMVFELENNEVFITYFDPENHQAPKRLISDLALVMDKLGIQYSFKEILVSTQTSDNCGPELVEDFIQYLTGERVEERHVVDYHSELLSNYLLGCTDVSTDLL